MPSKYSDIEKQSYLDAFKISGKTKTQYARENNIPEATFRAWVKEENNELFGAIDLNTEATPIPVKTKEIRKSTIFCCENIKIELKDSYDKALLRKIVEVLINDM